MPDEILATLQQLPQGPTKTILQRAAARILVLEAKLAQLDLDALKVGSPVDAHGQRIQRLADPHRGSDAVTLGFLRRYVATQLQIAAGVPARPITDAGAGPTIPPPTGTFTATPNTFGAGGGTTNIVWTSQNATSAESSLIGAIALNGNVNVFIAASVTATITLRGPGGITTYPLTITVATTPPPTPVPTGTLVATPSAIAPGASATLTWSSTDATSARITPGVGAVTPVAAGNVTVSPAVTTIYELILDGPGGQAVIQRTVTVTTIVPTGDGMVAGVLTWGFSNRGVRYPWKGFTAFGMYCDALKPDRAYRAAEMLNYFKAAGCNVPRVMLSLAGVANPPNPWPGWEPMGFRLYPPEIPNFYTQLPLFVRYCNSLGMMPELVVFGGFQEIWPGNPAGMILHTQQVAQALLNERGCFVEIANEWDAIGFTAPEQIIALANYYKAVDPSRVLALSSPNGDRARGTMFINTLVGEYLTNHIGRYQVPPYQWVLEHYGNPTFMQGVRPAVSDEPVNAGYALYGAYEPDPQHWYAFGALGRIMGWSGTFHYEGGLFEQIPLAGSAEELCLKAWINAHAVPSPDGGGVLFGATPTGNQPPCPWATSGGNTGIIGRTTPSGSAYGLVFGNAALPALLPGWNPASLRQDLFTLGYSHIRGFFVDPVGF